MSRPPLIEFTENGIYCREGNFYVDPWRPVDRAIITHAHSDHARPGHGSYLAHPLTVPLLRLRLGRELKAETLEYGTPLRLGKVTLSLHPAGHVPGSTQVRVEGEGEVWVIGGDYKLRKDGLSTPWEPVRCDVFVTESTFGLPIYKWPDPGEIREEIHTWWSKNRQKGKTSVITAYSLGKAQRILHMLDRGFGEIFVHPAIRQVNLAYREAGLDPGEFSVWQGVPTKRTQEALLVVPPGAAGGRSFRGVASSSTAHASGWMAVRGNKRRLAVDRGFVISDHADWTELNQAIELTSAERVFVTHGQIDPFVRWLREQGLTAHAVRTEFTGDLSEENPPATEKAT